MIEVTCNADILNADNDVVIPAGSVLDVVDMKYLLRLCAIDTFTVTGGTIFITPTGFTFTATV